MKFGAAYNLFDGEELIEESIDRISGFVDYIVIIYQHISNWGEQNDDSVIELLRRLKKEGKVDDVFQYMPDISQYPGMNELKKRQIGLEKCREAGCDYFLSIDADEYYTQDCLEYLMEFYKKHVPDITYSKMFTYYKDKFHILDPVEDYFVPLFARIHEGTRLVYSYPSQCLVDPTRRVTTISKHHLFHIDNVVMHHLSYVRDDIRKKLLSSSARVNFNDSINEFVEYFDNWVPGMKARVIGKEITEYNTKFVKYLK